MSSSHGICIIGAGDRGNAHARAWHKLGAKVVSVADVDEDRATRLAREFGARAFVDYREALQVAGQDIVSVCVPAAFHGEVVIASARQGLHILCEKPAALSIDEANRMIREAESAGVLLSFSFQRRFEGGLNLQRELLSSGRLGRPAMYNVIATASIRPKRAMHDMHGNAGPVVDLCCHTFDLWRYLFESEPVRVKASGLTLARGRHELKGIEVLAIDTATLTVEFASGDIGSMTVSWGLPPGIEGPRGEHILGPKGILIPGSTRVEVREEGGRKEVYDFETVDLDFALISDFTQALDSGRAPRIAPKDGLITLAMSLAGLRSIEMGKAVEIGEILDEGIAK